MKDLAFFDKVDFCDIYNKPDSNLKSSKKLKVRFQEALDILKSQKKSQSHSVPKRRNSKKPRITKVKSPKNTENDENIILSYYNQKENEEKEEDLEVKVEENVKDEDNQVDIKPLRSNTRIKYSISQRLQQSQLKREKEGRNESYAPPFSSSNISGYITKPSSQILNSFTVSKYSPLNLKQSLNANEQMNVVPLKEE